MAETLGVMLRNGRHVLASAGIETAALDADVLLREVLGLSREDMLREPDRIVSEPDRLRYHAFIVRRMAYEPVAYLLGKKEFYGREFTVNRATLIPRPDSETLIDAVLKYSRLYPQKPRILDCGTGSGCLLLTLLAEIDDATGVGIDISEEALAVAKVNADKLGLAKRVNFRINGWKEEEGEAFDLVVTNPPYIKRLDMPGLHPDVSLFEPPSALDGGEDGLACYRQLAECYTQWLKPGGIMFIECGLGQHDDIVRIFKQKKLTLLGIEKDLAGIDRCIIMN